MTSIEKALRTWHTLQDALRDCTEDYAKLLLRAEILNQNRPFMLKRIHSRINRLRAKREREELCTPSPSTSRPKR
jgi:hypothetical protein